MNGNTELEIINRFVPLEKVLSASSQMDSIPMYSHWLLEAIKLLNKKYYTTNHHPRWFLDHRKFIREQFDEALPFFHNKVAVLKLILNEVQNHCNVIEISVPGLTSHHNIGTGFKFTVEQYDKCSLVTKEYEEYGIDSLHIIYNDDAHSKWGQKLRFNIDKTVFFSIDEGSLLDNSILMMVHGKPAFEGLDFLMGIKYGNTTIAFHRYL